MVSNERSSENTQSGRFALIDSFGFGSLVIDGKAYNSDLIIYPDGRIETPWWRQSGHRLTVDDIDALIASNPDAIVAGTGVNGLMKPDKILEKELLQKGIQFVAEKNQTAVDHYNRLIKDMRVGACFHLTC